MPEALRIARRAMRVVKLNIGFTALYNLVGLGLAAFGFAGGDRACLRGSARRGSFAFYVALEYTF